LGGIEVEGDAREPITGHFERLGHGNACRARLERIEVHSALSIDDTSDVRPAGRFRMPAHCAE
jgi:hypothetical protein